MAEEEQGKNIVDIVFNYYGVQEVIRYAKSKGIYNETQHSSLQGLLQLFNIYNEDMTRTNKQIWNMIDNIYPTYNTRLVDAGYSHSRITAHINQMVSNELKKHQTEIGKVAAIEIKPMRREEGVSEREEKVAAAEAAKQQAVVETKKAEEIEKKAMNEEVKKKIEAEEAEKKVKEAEAIKKKAEKEEIKKKTEAEEADKKAKEAEAKKSEEAKKLSEEAEKKSKEAEEAKKKVEQAEAAKKKAEEEETKKKAAAEIAEENRKKAEEQTTKKKAEQEVAKKKLEEEEAVKKKVEEELAAKKKAEEEEAAKKKLEEEEKIVKEAAEEYARKQAEEVKEKMKRIVPTYYQYDTEQKLFPWTKFLKITGFEPVLLNYNDENIAMKSHHTLYIMWSEDDVRRDPTLERLSYFYFILKMAKKDIRNSGIINIIEREEKKSIKEKKRTEWYDLYEAFIPRFRLYVSQTTSHDLSDPYNDSEYTRLRDWFSDKLSLSEEMTDLISKREETKKVRIDLIFIKNEFLKDDSMIKLKNGIFPAKLAVDQYRVEFYIPGFFGGYTPGYFTIWTENRIFTPEKDGSSIDIDNTKVIINMAVATSGTTKIAVPFSPLQWYVNDKYIPIPVFTIFLKEIPKDTYELNELYVDSNNIELNRLKIRVEEHLDVPEDILNEIEEKKKIAETIKKKLEEEAVKKKTEEELAAKKKLEEEAVKKKTEELAAKKRAEEELAAKKKLEEEAVKKKAEEELAAKKKLEEEAVKKKLEEEMKKAMEKAKKEIAEKQQQKQVKEPAPTVPITPEGRAITPPRPPPPPPPVSPSIVTAPIGTGISEYEKAMTEMKRLSDQCSELDVKVKKFNESPNERTVSMFNEIKNALKYNDFINKKDTYRPDGDFEKQIPEIVNKSKDCPGALERCINDKNALVKDLKEARSKIWELTETFMAVYIANPKIIAEWNQWRVYQISDADVSVIMKIAFEDLKYVIDNKEKTAIVYPFSLPAIEYNVVVSTSVCDACKQGKDKDGNIIPCPFKTKELNLTCDIDSKLENTTGKEILVFMWSYRLDEKKPKHYCTFIVDQIGQGTEKKPVPRLYVISLVRQDKDLLPVKFKKFTFNGNDIETIPALGQKGQAEDQIDRMFFTSRFFESSGQRDDEPIYVASVTARVVTILLENRTAGDKGYSKVRNFFEKKKPQEDETLQGEIEDKYQEKALKMDYFAERLIQSPLLKAVGVGYKYLSEQPSLPELYTIIIQMVSVEKRHKKYVTRHNESSSSSAVAAADTHVDWDSLFTSSSSSSSENE